MDPSSEPRQFPWHKLLAAPFVAAMLAWVVFLWTFPVLAVWNGMYIAALLLAGLGLLVDALGLPPLLQSLPREPRRAAIFGNLTFHILIVGIAAALMFRPPGAFDRVPGSERLGERLLVPYDDGVYAITAESIRWVDTQEVGRSLDYGGGQAWVGGVDDRYGLWVLPDKQPAIYYREADAWARWNRGPGWSQHAALWRGRAFVRTGGGLKTSPGPGAPWTQVRLDGSVFSVSSTREGVWAAGSKVWFSADGATFQEVSPPGYDALRGEVVAGYVFTGSLLACKLWAPDGRRPCPVRDARVLAVSPPNPRDPEAPDELWLGSWGQGVWYSPDGGWTWLDYGAQGTEVRQLAVDWKHRRVWFSAGGMSVHQGIWSAPF